MLLENDKEKKDVVVLIFNLFIYLASIPIWRAKKATSQWYRTYNTSSEQLVSTLLLLFLILNGKYVKQQKRPLSIIIIIVVALNLLIPSRWLLFLQTNNKKNQNLF
jgi:hypothetical protein